STLEEVADADLLVRVVDASHPDPAGQIAAVREVLQELGAGDVRELIAINKADIADPVTISSLLVHEPHAVIVSAVDGTGIDELRAAIDSELPQLPSNVDVVVTYARGDLLNQIHVSADIECLRHVTDGIHVIAHVYDALADRMHAYSVCGLSPRLPGLCRRHRVRCRS